jgi:predicted GIY-YIG superfamily endonuclease
VLSSKGYRPLRLIYTEKYATRSEAFRREMYNKTAEGKRELKEKLIELGLW